MINSIIVKKFNFVRFLPIERSRDRVMSKVLWKPQSTQSFIKSVRFKL